MKSTAYKILIDQKPFDHPNQFITGKQIKNYVNAPANYGAWAKIKGAKDVEIGDDEQFDLSLPGREHFFTGPKTTTEG